MRRSIIGLLQRTQRKKEIGIIKLNKKFKPGVRRTDLVRKYFDKMSEICRTNSLLVN